MFSSRKSNSLINKVHERSLRIVSGDNRSSFKSLLSKCKEITIHQRNLQVQMYISTNYSIFFYITRNTHNVRNFQEIFNVNRKTVKYGVETILDRTSFLWANLPNEYKLATSLHN